MVPPRTRKIFSLARRIQSRLHTHPDIALRGARRLERIVNKQSPFTQGTPSVLDGLNSDYASYSQTKFRTSTGVVRAL